MAIIGNYLRHLGGNKCAVPRNSGSYPHLILLAKSSAEARVLDELWCAVAPAYRSPGKLVMTTLSPGRTEAIRCS
jgi:hypothetical protein